MTTAETQPLALDYAPPPGPAPREHAAVAALLVATVFWGCGFTWAKSAGKTVHALLGLPAGSAFGPIFILACRFLLGAVLLLVAVPAARIGWTVRGAVRIAFTGLLLAAGLVVQHLGLDRTSEAVSAFLTSLTVLFVPLLLTLVLRKPPAPVMWLGVVLATAGVWLMTGATPTGFGVGELMGLSCAFAFSLYLLAVNSLAKTEDSWRMSAGQFLVVGVACAVAAALVPGGHSLSFSHRILAADRDVWLNALALTIFPTVGAFTLLNHFQPRLDATHAALIYLMEPVVAAAYAYAFAGRGMHPLMLVGAGLILAANVLVEVLKARGPRGV